MQHKDEAELIAQTLSGNQLAYAELIERYKNALYHHCFAIVRSEDAAEDITQETFITAYYKLNTYDPQYRLSTWLFRISTNTALNYLKKGCHEHRASDAVLLMAESNQRSPHGHAVDSELHMQVAALPPKYRAVISLYYWQGKSYRDIAVILGVPEGTVKGWMNRAKSQLRKELS